MRLPAAIRFVHQSPDKALIVDHIAKPKVDGSDREAWMAGICALAERPNVFCKLSGLVNEAEWFHWQPAIFRPYLDTVLRAFGVNRLMIGGDRPVCTLAADFHATLGVVLDRMKPLSADEQTAILGGTCALFYSVDG